LISNPAQANFNSLATAFFDLSDPEPRNVFIKGNFELDFFNIAAKFLSKNGTFFDLGANQGLCSFGLIPSHPNSIFHLFEANESLVALMEKSVNLHHRTSFFLNHVCVTANNGTTNFYLEKNQSGQSHVATANEKGVEVLNLVLDEYINFHNISRIDFMKIDLEGHELSALNGMKKSLQCFVANAIYLEIMPENQSRYGLKPEAPLHFLEALGYRLAYCKEEDFIRFNLKTCNLTTSEGNLRICLFKASDYPMNYATDVLAIAPSIIRVP